MKWIDRHPKTTILIVNFIIIIFYYIFSRDLFKVLINYNPGYYTCQMTDNKHNRIYPYGIIKINNYGYPNINS